jgi:hypothetical protein
LSFRKLLFYLASQKKDLSPTSCYSRLVKIEDDRQDQTERWAGRPPQRRIKAGVLLLRLQATMNPNRQALAAASEQLDSACLALRLCASLPALTSPRLRLTTRRWRPLVLRFRPPCLAPASPLAAAPATVLLCLLRTARRAPALLRPASKGERGAGGRERGYTRDSKCGNLRARHLWIRSWNKYQVDLESC